MAEENPEPGSFEKLLTLARRAWLAEFWEDPEFWRDALWLAQYVPEGTGEDRRPRAAETTPPPTTTPGPTPGATTTLPPTTTTPPPQTDQGPADGSASGQLYPQFDTGNAGARATTIYVPASGALPQPLELARALRPFQQKFHSRHLSKLDIDATVELSAERREMTPVLTREKERWFSLSLLVDDAPSMAVWRKTAREFARFLGQLGVFRDVRIWFADQDLRLTSGGGREAKPKQLVDPAGRTLIVVLTNGVGLHWRSRELAEWLTDWARSGPVSICSLLPPMRWQFTDIGPAYLWARASAPGAGNRLLAGGEGPDRVEMKDGATLFPIFPLTRRGLADWAAMQMSRRETKTAAISISPAWFDLRRDVTEEPPEARDAARRMAEFRSFASPEAAKLLEYFSAIPLYLPVMRMVQATMLPESPLSAMAEVLMSGLVVQAQLDQGTAQGREPEPMLFEFAKDAREYLRDRTSVADLERIHREVRGAIQEYIERRAGSSTVDFEALVRDPQGLKDLPADARHFVEVTAETIRALGYRGRRRPPAPPLERPAVYVLWIEAEVEAFSLEIIAGLRERGLRVLEARKEEPPAEGCFLAISGVEEFSGEVSEASARTLESGFAGVDLFGPGNTVGDEEFVYADAYPSRRELLDALVEKLGGLDVTPPPKPKGAPRIQRGTTLRLETEAEGLLREGVAVMYPSQAFDPVRYLAAYCWLRETRLQFKGGIHWLENGDVAADRPDQLLIYVRPEKPQRIPAASRAVLLEPNNFALFGLPESTAVFEGPEEAIAPMAANMAQRLQGVFPDGALELIRHSPHLLGLAEQMTSNEGLWTMIRESFEAEWEMRPGGAHTVPALVVRMLVTALDSLPARLRDAAGAAAAIRGNAPEELINSLVPSDTWEWLQENELTKAPGYVPTEECQQVTRLSRHWQEWNRAILNAAGPGILSENWFDVVSANAYVRQNAMGYMLESKQYGWIAEMVTEFRWWRLRLEADGAAALFQDLQSLPEGGDFGLIRAFVNKLWKDPALSAGDVAAAILQSDMPLPEPLRMSARASMPTDLAPPAYFVLLAASAPPERGHEDGAADWAAEAIAREIARRQGGLVDGEESNQAAVRAFVQERLAMKLSPETAVRTVTKDAAMKSVQIADAVVLLGGAELTEAVARTASAAHKRLFAVPGLGGSAARIFETATDEGGSESRPAWTQKIESPHDAARVARALLDGIEEHFFGPRAQPSAAPDMEAARAAIRDGRAAIYVDVVGTGVHQLDAVSQAAAEEVGRALAEAGFGLITGAWAGVDFVTASAYLKAGGKWLVHVTTDFSTDRFAEALVVDARERDWSQRLADAVVLIGGQGATLEVFEAARKLERPVFPYGPSGGDAKKALESLNAGSSDPLRGELSPLEFAEYVVRKLHGGSTRIWELATEYDAVRQTLPSGAARTSKMTELFQAMLQENEAPGEMHKLQASYSAGRRLAAIAMLIKNPRKEELDWLAGRLENPRVETPFVGFQAANALHAAVLALNGGDLGVAEKALEKARRLGEQLTGDPGRLRVLATAERDLLRKRSREEDLDLRGLVDQELMQHGNSQHVTTRDVLIFLTSGQKTWISFTTAGVACVLDNRPRGEKTFAVQWFQTLESITPQSVITRDRPGQPGLLTIGERRNWLYSRELFDAERLRERVLRELSYAEEFRDRLRRYGLL